VQQSYALIREPVSTPPLFPNRESVESALKEWRRHVLAWLGEELYQAGIAREAAADGLAISRRNPGAVAEDVVKLLWSDLETACILHARLDRAITGIDEMALPDLLVLFSRTNKLKTWPWEGDRWQLPELNF